MFFMGMLERFAEYYAIYQGKVDHKKERELRQYLDMNGFELVASYDWEAKGKAELGTPKKETFRILAVSRRKP